MNKAALNLKAYISLVMMFSFGILMPCFPQTFTPQIEPYTKDEFPQWAHDLRRTEVVTFGSLPFATLTVTLGFGIARWANGGSFPNPLDKSASGYSQDEQIQILLISAGISVALGLTDLTINLVKRHNAKNRQNSNSGAITVTPISESPPPESEDLQL
jgi:hypothetical protein